jgi:hypothetical protein
MLKVVMNENHEKCDGSMVVLVDVLIGGGWWPRCRGRRG